MSVRILSPHIEKYMRYSPSCPEKLSVVALVVAALAITLGPSLSFSAPAITKKKVERLAVIGLEAKYGVNREFAEGLSVIVRDTIHNFGEHHVLSDDDIKAVASREHLLQALGDDGNGQNLSKFGKSLGTRFMVAGSISKYGQTYTVSLRMLDTSGSSPGVIKRVSEDCNGSEDRLIESVREVAAKLIDQEYKPTAKSVQQPSLQDSTKAAIDGYTTPRPLRSLTGIWSGYWRNSLGEKAPDSLLLEESSDGKIKGIWDGKVHLSGRWLNPSTIELYGETTTRAYEITGIVEGGTLTFQYMAHRLDAAGSYQGTSIFTRKK